MNYGVTFNGKHSLNDYGLYLSERPIIGNPEPQLYMIKVPGRNGLIDATASVTGDTSYSNRQLQFVFATQKTIAEQVGSRDALNNDIHGKQVKIILDEDPDYYYFGRATVEWHDAEDWKAKCTVTVDAEPFKRKITPTTVTLRLYAADAPHPNAEIKTTPTRISPSTSKSTTLYYGSKDFPHLRLTGFDFIKLYAIAAESSWEGTRKIAIYDGDNAVYQTDFPAGTENPEINVAAITEAGVDVSRIYLITISGHESTCTDVRKCLGPAVYTTLNAPVAYTINPTLVVAGNTTKKVYVGGSLGTYRSGSTYELGELAIGPRDNMFVLRPGSETNATATLTYQEAMI